MLGIIRRAVERRRDLRYEAMALIEAHGQKAWVIARSNASDMRLTEDERYRWMRIKGLVERELGISWQADTATRYLEAR